MIEFQLLSSCLLSADHETMHMIELQVTSKTVCHTVELLRELAVIHTGAADICVYTDGSLLEDRSGAGVYIEVDRQPQVTMSERLPPCTVFQSELRIIHMACEHLCLHEHNNKDIHIHVNSQAALQSLVKLQVTSKTVCHTVELLRELAVIHTVILQ
jgi:hypothetical protein